MNATIFQFNFMRGALLCGVGLLTVFACAIQVAAQNRGKWVTLFDGKNINNLRGYRQSAFPTKGWIIENGVLRTDPTAAAAERVDLITNDKYRNFELEYEWRISPGGNSGVMYHVAELPDKPTYFTGPEVQILDDDKHPDAKRGKEGSRTAGALYDLIAPSANKTLRPVGEFNKARLVVRNGKVEHYLNGKKVVDYDLNSDQMKQLIAESKFNEMPRFGREGEGHIAFQHHGEEVAFRNIRIRRL